MKISTLLNTTTQALNSVADNPRLEAELLIAHALKLERAQLYAHSTDELSIMQEALVAQLVERRLHHEPIAYIVGHKEFWSLNLLVNSNTLIPRPETESLVEWILVHLPKDKLSIADLGTGSGALALALAHERPLWEITATDNSEAALTVAKNNAKQLGLNHIEFRLGHWCDALIKKEYAAIISNPPYIAEHDSHLSKLKHEPTSALISKNQGLADLEKIISTAAPYLAKKGYLILEHGFDQGSAVRALLHQYNFTSIETRLDLNGQERFTTATLL